MFAQQSLDQAALPGIEQMNQHESAARVSAQAGAQLGYLTAGHTQLGYPKGSKELGYLKVAR